MDLVCGEQFSGQAHARKFGKLTIFAEESISSKTTVELKLRCSELESKDLFSKSVQTHQNSIIYCHFESYDAELLIYIILLRLTGSISGGIQNY